VFSFCSVSAFDLVSSVNQNNQREWHCSSLIVLCAVKKLLTHPLSHRIVSEYTVYRVNGLSTNNFYRAMHLSAKRGIAIACRLSVRRSVRLSVGDVGEL